MTENIKKTFEQVAKDFSSLRYKQSLVSLLFLIDEIENCINSEGLDRTLEKLQLIRGMINNELA